MKSDRRSSWMTASQREATTARSRDRFSGSAAGSGAGGNRSVDDHGGIPEKERKPSLASIACTRCNAWYKKVVPPVLRDGHRRRGILRRILYSKQWRNLLMVMAFILLFGSQIRNILIPPAGDTVCNAIFCIVFILFSLDIIMRVDAEPHYFILRIFNVLFFSSGGGNSGGDGANGSARGISASEDRAFKNAAEPIPATGCFNIEIGSFLFWCDILSTLTLLHEIPFIDKNNFAEVSLSIVLDSYGIPVSGLAGVLEATPIEANVDMLVTIGKTARVARFVRSTTALKVSSKVDWFACLNLFDPSWWWAEIRKRQHYHSNAVVDGKVAQQPGMGEASWVGKKKDINMSQHFRKQQQPNNNTGDIQYNHHQKFQSDQPQLQHSTSNNNLKPTITIYGGDVRKWFSSSTTGTDNYPKTVSAGSPNSGEEGGNAPPSKRAIGAVLRVLGLGGDLSLHDEETRRHISASKIQRSWRLHRLRAHKKDLRSGPRDSPDESQVGTAMRELTGQRVATGILLALAMTSFFTYTEIDITRPVTMMSLHNQTAYPNFADKALAAARSSAIPELYYYQMRNNEVKTFPVPWNNRDLRPREIVRVSIEQEAVANSTTVGLFCIKHERRNQAIVSLLSTFFILFVWFVGVTAFAGPVMILVVIPIERMVRLLGIMMMEPVGYENTTRYKRFMEEEDNITKNTNWSKEVLNGMETSFLMSTILRIGSLMKVGFGSAGVEIIRNNLQKGQNKSIELISEGSRVFCIFLFCDIRSFTDCTECLQEEVFVFTNRVAAVVHSICNSYGGSANKNIGDAFLLSWLLKKDDSPSRRSVLGLDSEENFSADNHQADKALLSVVKICLALNFDNFYIEAMSNVAREALLAKLSKRKGPVVQMGFGLHAGQAVQGAIGSGRKIDATYVSEHVERSELLESSTKRYGVMMLMSDSFHRLLHPNNRRRCRKIDQIMIKENDDEDDEDEYDDDTIDFYTFDMDINMCYMKVKQKKKAKSEAGNDTDSEAGSERGLKRDGARVSKSRLGRRKSSKMKELNSDELSEAFALNAGTSQMDEREDPTSPQELIVSNGPAHYNADVWVSPDMHHIREKYTKEAIFFQTFNSGLQSFYARDWERAKQCFATLLDRFEDGPSRYFMTEMEKHNGVPPRNFKPYGSP